MKGVYEIVKALPILYKTQDLLHPVEDDLHEGSGFLKI